MLDPGESYGTIDLNVKMLRPVPRGIELRAKGKVIHMSRRLGISDATLTDNDGIIYAHATSTCMILRKEKIYNVTAFKSQEIRTQAFLKAPAAVKSIAASNQRHI